MVKPRTIGAGAAFWAFALAAPSQATTTPAVDLAGDHAFAAAGATLIQRSMGSAAAIEVPVWPRCSVGLTAGIGAPLSPQDGAGTRDTALRLTYRWKEEDGWVVGAALSAELRSTT